MFKENLQTTARVFVSSLTAFLFLLHYWIFTRLLKVSDEKLKRSRLDRGFHHILERMVVFGCVPFNENPVVKRVTELSDSLLDDLINDRLAAIHVKSFLSAEENLEFLEKISGRDSQNSLIANGFRTDADNIGYTEDTLNILDSYYTEEALQHALKYNMELRELLSNGGYFSPLAKLTWKLNEMHPYGARKRASRFTNRYDWYQSLGYIVRIHHDKSEKDFSNKAAIKFRGFIHRDAPSEAERKSKKIIAFSANIYHQINQGGELYIWSTMSRTKVQRICNLKVDQMSQNRIYEFVSKCCPFPEIISPEPGDLVLLNTSYIHAVNPSRGGKRISSQSFFTITNNGLVY